MKNCNARLAIDEELKLRKKYQIMTWAFLLMMVGFIGIGVAVLASSLPVYSIAVVTIVGIAIDLMRHSIGSEIYRIVAYQKAQVYKMHSSTSAC